MLWSNLVTVFAFASSVLAKPIAIQRRDETKIMCRATLQPRAAASGSYSVVSGDTGTAIAAVYSITFTKLSNANPNVNWSNLQVGQSLNMPSARTPFTYTVVSGDSKSSIAQAYNVYSDDLSAANPNVNFDSLRAGTRLRIPGYGRYTTYTVTSGDYGYAIADAFGISFDSLSAANPNVDWNNLQVGQVLSIPAGVSPSTGRLPSPATPPKSSTTTTTTTSRSTSLATTTTFLTSTRTTTITSTRTSTTTSTTQRTSTTIPTSTNASTSTTRTSSTNTNSSVSTSAISNTQRTSTTLNPTSSRTSTVSISTTTSTRSSTTVTSTIPPTATVTGANYVQGGNNDDGIAGTDTYTFYKGDGSTSQGWPAKSKWISFSKMWSNVAPFLGQSCQSQFNVANNSPEENQLIYNAIQTISSKSGVDHRLILATIIQESSGCVRVKTTVSPDGTVTNPGLMQDFNGTGSCNRNGVVQNPCPQSEIYQMISDGTFGTTSDGGKTYVAGLVQDINSAGTSGAQNYYRASRIYNSGSIPADGDLGAPGSTRCYVSDIANRLTGWVTASSTCSY